MTRPTDLEIGETIGQIADQVDSLHGALQLPMPGDMHVKFMLATLPQIVKQLQTVAIQMMGHNPWE